MKQIICALGALAMLGAAPQLRSQSESLAKELAGLLTHLHLDAMATQDPEASDRFVAALFFQNEQLLVVAGRHAAPAWIQGELKKSQYKDVYLDLSSGAIPESKVFFHDLNANGLHSGREGSVDVMYEHVVDQVVFDGNWTKHKMSEQAYDEKFTQADEQYSRLLRLAISEAKTKTAS